MPAVKISAQDADWSCDEFRLIDEGLDAHNLPMLDNLQIVGVFAKDAQERLVAGAQAVVTGDCMLVKMLWCDPSCRGRGIGRDVMSECENEALRRGCVRVAVDTMSYQAPEFYKKIGYAVKATVPDFYQGYDRVFLEKKIAETGLS